MNCDQCVQALVDLARGSDAADLEPVRAHLAGCGACAQRFRDEQQLTAGLRALARATATSAPSEALEGRLLALFDEQVASREPAATAGKGMRAWWMRAAAVLALTTAGTVAWLHVTAGSRPVKEPRTASTPRRAPRVVARGPDVQATPPVGQASPQVRQAAPSPAATPRSHRGRAGRSARPPRAVVAEGFVPLPWAAGLPDFDRGEIVRMDIPLTALRLYGIEIPADAWDRPVRADMLVGQDGQPRAIRLVSPEPDTKQP